MNDVVCGILFLLVFIALAYCIIDDTIDDIRQQRNHRAKEGNVYGNDS
jgi:cytochrome c biogenesis protein ResB